MTVAKPKIVIRSPKRWLVNKENQQPQQGINTSKYPGARQEWESYSRLVCGRDWENIDPKIQQTYAATEDEFLFTLLRTWEVANLKTDPKHYVENTKNRQ